MKVVRRIPPVFISIVVLLLIWQWASTLESLAGMLPSATDTLVAFKDLMLLGETWTAILETLEMAFIGFAIGIVIAIPIGVLVGLSKFAYMSSKFTFNFLRVIPGIVIIPIALLIFGPTLLMGIVLVAWPVVFIMIVQTSYGVRDADPVLLETMRCYGQGWFKQIRYCRIPSAAPLIALGMRICVVIAVLVAVVAGLIGGAPGLGRALLFSQLNGFPATTFAIVLLMGIMGMLIAKFVEYLQPKVIFWMPR